MFNKRTLQIIRAYMKTCALLGSNLYTWDDRNECVSECTNFSRKFTFTIAVGHTVLYLCFLFWRLVQVVQKPKTSFPDVVWIYIWINQSYWSLTTYYNGYRKKGEVVSLFRGLKKLSTVLQKGKYPSNLNKFMTTLISKDNRLREILDLLLIG